MVNKLKKYWLGLVLILFSLTPILWFVGKGGAIINGLDTNFPLDPSVWFNRRFFVWNDVASGGVNFASSTAGIFFHLIQVIPFTFGFSLQLTEIISLIFWFSLVTLSAYYFISKVFPSKKYSHLIFIAIYVFNIYLFNTWENVKVANLAVVTSMPLFLGIFISYINRQISISKFIFFTSLTAVVASGAGINPAYFMTILLSIIIFGFVFKQFKPLFLMLIVILFVNSFWILPTFDQLLFSSSRATTLSDIGYTSWVDSLSENTSLFNVIRFQGAWDWYANDNGGAPLYIPYATNYFKSLPFISFSLLIPALAIVGFLVKDKYDKRFKIYFAFMLLLGLFLGVGTHSPTGVLFKLFIKYMPFFSFFRSPWYIFTPFLIIAIASLTSYIFLYKNRSLRVFAIIVVAGNLIYTYPLLTGKIYRPKESDSFFVNIPPYVFDAGKWLENKAIEGRILSYPGDDIENYRWGYRGIETILNLMSNKETLYSGFNAQSASSAKLITALYNAFYRDQNQIAAKLAAKLNVGYLFIKDDQSSLFNQIPKLDSGYQIIEFDKWKFYKVPEDKYLPKIFTSAKFYYGTPYEKQEKLIGVADKDDIVVYLDDSEIKRIPDHGRHTGDIILASNSQQEFFESYQKAALKQQLGFEQKDPNELIYTWETKGEGYYRPLLESYSLENFGIDPSEPLSVNIDGKEQILSRTSAGDFVEFNQVYLNSGMHKLKMQARNNNLLLNGNGIFDLTNRENEEKFILFTIKPFISFYPYLVKFDYKNIYGRKSMFKVEQKSATVNYKFQTEGPPFSPETTEFSFYFDPVPTRDTYLDIKPLVMPIEDDPLGTKIEYSNLEIYPVITNRMIFVKDPVDKLTIPENLTYEKINPARYEGEIKGSYGSHTIVFSENYTPDWQMKLYNLDGSEITYDPIHFSANMYANAWFIEDLKGDYKFEIYYKPQTIFIYAAILSILSIVFIVGFYIYSKLLKK